MMFWKALGGYKNTIAIYDPKADHAYTYSELEYHINYLRTEIEISNSLCLILTQNNYTSILTYLYLMNSNNTIMLLNENTTDELLHNIIKNYYPDVIISNKHRNITNYDYKKVEFANNIAYALFRKAYQERKSETKIMLSTSGSTGSSKFVRLSEKNIHANAKSISEYLEININDRAITSLPINYSFGLSIVNSHLLSGASIILSDDTIVQSNFWKIFNKYQCTTFSGVPYSYQILQRLKFAEMELPSLRYFTQAGGHLVSSTKKYFYDLSIKKNYRFIVMYGQTEATARISYVPYNSLIEKIDSIGIPIPEGKITLSSESDLINNREVGEIIYEGPNVMLGYAQCREDIYKTDELNGILHTGDIGYRDSDGFFYITGRKKRFIKSYGNRINLDDIERLIENKIRLNCAVIGDDNVIKILVEDSSSCLSHSTIKQVLSDLSLRHPAIEIKNITQIPISANSKKDYQKLKELY